MRSGGSGLRRRVLSCGLGVLGLAVATARAQEPRTAVQLVNDMVAHEDDDRAHVDCFEFMASERSDRTGGHLWVERVVETPLGRVRLLLTEDGAALSAERAGQERAKLAAMVADPREFKRKELSERNDEAHARVMLDLLPRAFLFDNVRLEGGVWKMDFHPNPGYSPSGIEEKVLHGMSGWVAIDQREQRLIEIDGKLPQDVSIGFGLLATIKAGSHFGSERQPSSGHWRTVHVVTDIRGKAGLFKTVAKNSEVTRSEFRYLEPGITLEQAVQLVEKDRE
jgi:hypothetical protein